MLRSRTKIARTRRAKVATCLTLLLLTVAATSMVAPSLAAAAPSDVGFQVHALWFERSSSEMEQELDLIDQLGGNTVRVDVAWSSLEEEEGQISGWYLERLDAFMQAASARGLKVVASLSSTPCWASSAPESLKQGCRGEWWTRGVENYPPIDPANFGAAAHFMTARYGDQLAALEIWNEPNSERFLVSSNPAAAYAEILKAAYPAAKSGNASVPVLAGALAMADRSFLEELYADGIKGFYDGISIHPYNEWRDPYDRWQPQWRQDTFLPGLESIHEAELAVGDTAPIWITEFGWDTCTGNAWCVNEAQQALYMSEAFQILDTLPYVEGAIGYELRNESDDKSDFESNWGIVNSNFTPKPAFAAISAALHGTAPPVPVELQLEVSKSGQVVAAGQATQRQQLEVGVKGCTAQTTSSDRLVTTSGHGRYRVRLGALPQLRSCQVKVKPLRSRRSVVKSIPGRHAFGLQLARVATG